MSGLNNLYFWHASSKIKFDLTQVGAKESHKETSEYCNYSTMK